MTSQQSRVKSRRFGCIHNLWTKLLVLDRTWRLSACITLCTLYCSLHLSANSCQAQVLGILAIARDRMVK